MKVKFFRVIILLILIVGYVSTAEGVTVKRPATKKTVRKKPTAKRTVTTKRLPPKTTKKITTTTRKIPSKAPAVIVPAAIVAAPTPAPVVESVEKNPVYIYLKGGVDLMSSYTAVPKYSDGTVDGMGYFGDFQLMIKPWKRVEIGIGAAYQMHPNMPLYTLPITEGTTTKPVEEQYQIPNYGSTPIYAATRIFFLDPKTLFQPFLILNVGYSVNFLGSSGQKTSQTTGELVSANYGSYSSGLYYAAGLGTNFKNFTFDVMYAVNTSTYSLTIIKDDIATTTDFGAINYSRISIGIGYRFDLTNF
ncbi:MAG: hypothetical protein ACRCSK_05350 [Fusobacteriaceae bacterium]